MLRILTLLALLTSGLIIGTRPAIGQRGLTPDESAVYQRCRGSAPDSQLCRAWEDMARQANLRDELHELEQRRQRARVEREQQQRRDEAARQAKEKHEQTLRSGDIPLGATADEVRRVWGEPADRRRSRTMEGARETWVYDDRRRLVFFNGRVVQVDD